MGLTARLEAKIARNAAAALGPDETVQATFNAQTRSQYWVLLSFWILVFNSPYRAVVVTDRRILIYRNPAFQRAKLKELVAELPRSTRIGEPHGALFWRCTTLDRPYYIHRMFGQAVREADRLAPAA